MPPRNLESFAHALGAAHDLSAALVALGEMLAELDRAAVVAYLRRTGKAEVLTEIIAPNGAQAECRATEVAVAHLPAPLAAKIAAGVEFADAGTQAADVARLLDVRAFPEGGHLSLKGIRVDGHLAGVIACGEPRRVFGTRVIERFAPATALFEIAVARFSDREARAEAVQALEDVTRRLHAEHLQALAALEQQLAQARGAAPSHGDAVVAAQRDAARAAEEVRRLQQRVRALEHQVGAGTAQLEQAHVELHRRSELLRQRSRTLYLLERVLALAGSTTDAQALADGLLSLVGDDLQAQRCSLMLRTPGADTLFLAASRGLAPSVKGGRRVRIGEGVAGRVAETREPLLVVDTGEGAEPGLLGDEYLTTGSFMSFPLVLHDQLLGVVNLTNRAQRGLFVEEDVERVRLLGLVCAVVASETGLNARLSGTVPGD